MNPTETKSAIVSGHLLQPTFAERWLGLAYTFSGTFILDGTDLTPERARRDFNTLYEATRSQRNRKWPRGVARFFLIPVYCATSFPKATWDYLYGYDRPGRWAISMKPVLFNSLNNRVEGKDAVQNDTLTYYWYLKELFAEGISRAAKHFGHQPELTTNSYDDLVAKLLSNRNETWRNSKSFRCR